MDDNVSNLLTRIVEKLGVNPCVLAIIVLSAFYSLLIYRMIKHQAKMEEIRVNQLGLIIKNNMKNQNKMNAHQAEMERRRYRDYTNSDSPSLATKE